jgi:outer membrane protein
MKQSIFLASVLLSCNCYAAQETSMSLDDAIILAHENNYNLLSSYQGFYAAKMAKPKAYSTLLPNVNLSSRYTKTKYTVNLVNSLIDNKHSRIDVATVSQSLFNGGASFAEIQIANNAVDASFFQLKNTSNSLSLQTIQAYDAILKAREVYEINVETKNIFEQYLDYTKTRFEAGVITKTSLLESEVRLAEAKASLEIANADLLNSAAIFQRLTGIEPIEKMQPIAINEGLVPENLEELLDIALSENPALLANKFTYKADSYQINRATAAILPKVSANAQFTRSDAKKDLNNRDSNAYFIALDIPVFNGGAEFASIKEKYHLAKQSELAVKELEQKIKEAAITAWNNYKTAKATLTARDEAVSAAALVLEGVKEEVTIGTRTTTDLLDAEQDLFNAKVAQRKTKSDLVNAIYSILQIMGALDALMISK